MGGDEGERKLGNSPRACFVKLADEGKTCQKGALLSPFPTLLRHTGERQTQREAVGLVKDHLGKKDSHLG